MMDERDEASGAELEAAETIGRMLMSDPDHPSWRDARFLDWLAADAREDARHRGGGLAARVAARARGEATMARAHARRLRVTQGGSPPVVRGDVGERGARHAAVIELGIAAGVGRELWDEPADAWVEVPDDAPAGDYVALRIVGDSMSPLMHTGDTVLVKRNSEV